MAMAQAASGKRHSFYADLERLKTHFDALDQDRTGYIGYSELQQLVQKMSGIEEAVLPELMDKLDRDKDGRVSFDDFQALFEVERESAMTKRLKTTASDVSMLNDNTEGPGSPPSKVKRRLPEVPDTSGVVMRHRPGRSLHRNSDFGLLSPIKPGTGQSSRPRSNEYQDHMPAQMQYLMTGFVDSYDTVSPQLKRNSKVLSFFNDSEDIVESIGDIVHTDDNIEVPSPPTSPTRGNEEVSNVVSLFESVIGTKDIDEAAIAKLCDHTKADQQEQEELLSLLHFLDKKKLGSVSVYEFVRGLQACKHSAEVGAFTPFKSPEEQLPPPIPRRHTIGSMGVPQLSEPFTPVHGSSRQSSTPLASTPSHPAYTNIILSVLDPDNSGFVKVESLVERIQELGVETELNSSLEDALTEAVTVDQSGRVSVNEFTASLEGALLTEGKSNNFLRQIALKSFHSEIYSLRSQMHQVSLERDNLQNSLNRTMDDKQKLAQMGQEHVDHLAKESEMRLQEQEDEHLQRLKETERMQRQERYQLEEKYTAAFASLQSQLDQLKSEEERLRADLKLALDENSQVIKELSSAHKEISKRDRMISMLQRDLESRSDYDLTDDGLHNSRIQELQGEVSDKGAYIQDLQEKLQDIKDKYDLLIADNEKMKQKYLTAKRDLQRRRNKQNRRNSTERPLSGYKSSKPKRPLSGSHFGRSSPIKPRIFHSPLDLAIGSEKNHPVLMEDMDESLSSDGELSSPIAVGEAVVEEVSLTVQEVLTGEEQTNSHTPTTGEDTPEEDDAFSRSSASLMEEIHKYEQKSMLESKVKKLEEERSRLQKQYQQLEQQLKEAEEEDRKEMLRELERTKQKQEELDRLILALGKQSRKLSKTRMEIDSRLQVAEENLANQLQGLRSSLTDNSGASATGNLADLIEELDTIRNRLEEERKYHDEDIANLKIQLSKAKEESYSQIDQSLKLEEEKAQAENLIAELQTTLESERVAHETEVNVLIRKLDNAVESLEKFKWKEHENEAHKPLISEDMLLTTTLKAELEESTKQAEEKLAAQTEQFKKEVEALKLDHKYQLERASKELQASHNRERDVNNWLTQTQKQWENAQTEIQEITKREAKHLQQISSLKDTGLSQKQEIELLKSDLVKHQDELKRLRSVEHIEKQTTANASALPKRSRSSRHGEDEPDYVPGPVNPRKLSSARRDSHDEIIDQMKDQLEQLQHILIHESRDGTEEGDLGLTLVQQLIAQNCTLGEEVQETKRIFSEEQKRLLELLSAKDIAFAQLHQQAAKERKDLQTSTLATTNEIYGVISNFNDSSNESISGYKERVEEAAAKLAHVRKLLQERDSQHLSSLDDMMSDLKHSREESDSHRKGAERMRSKLESQHKQEIQSLNNILEETIVLKERAKSRTQEVESELADKERQLKQKDDELQLQAEKIKELELQLQRLPIDEHFEAVQSVEVQPLNEALLLNTNQDSREIITIKEQVDTRCDAEREGTKEELITQALEEAEEKLEAFKQIQKTMEMQYQQEIQEIQKKHEVELLATNEVIEEHTTNLRELYVSVVDDDRDKSRAETLTHSQLVREISREMNRLKTELANEQDIASEMEATINRKIAEHEQVEAQIQTEHDEEVQALHQQKQQLARQLDDIKLCYSQSLKEQDKHTNELVSDLMDSKSDLEKQLQQKTEESLLVYQRVGELTDEKRVLVDIVEHLCVEAGKLIDVV